MAFALGFRNVNSGLQAGVIHSPVGTAFHHHVAPERAETPPSPTAIIPFSRDYDFVQRESILDLIHQSGAVPGSRTALVGLGGVGKSQIAIEYAYQVREQWPETWVFWVLASNVARYEQSFRAIADLVKLPGRRNPQNNIFQLVCTWLQSGKSGKWLVILDNVDEASFLLSVPQSHQDRLPSDPNRAGLLLLPLISYLPHCLHGSILMTSQRRDVALRLVEARDVVSVEPMSQIEAVTLIKKKLRGLDTPEEVESATSLAMALECMPLAIVQATSYIVHKAPRCSLRQYLEKFEQSDRKQASLLDFDGGQLRRDREAKNSIILTWQISFEHIQQTRSSAAELLSLISFCDRQGIPESLLRGLGREGADKEEEVEEEIEEESEVESEEGSDDDDVPIEDKGRSSDSDSRSNGDEEFERDISALRDFAFVSVNEDGTTFEMHRLVQPATRKWLREQGQDERWKQEFIRCICAVLPTGEYENWMEWQALLPQARSAAAQRPKNNTASLRDWASVLYKMAWYLSKMGRGDEGQKVAEDAMKVRINLLGRDHEESLWAISMVGDIYNLLGRWNDAETLFVEVMETRKKELGLDHPDMLTSMANLASTYRNQGRWEAAEELEVEVMETRKKKLGLDHPDTLTSMDNLAFTKHGHGQHIAAISIMQSCLQVRTRILGSQHPDTTSSAIALSQWEADLADTTSDRARLDLEGKGLR